MKTCNRCSESLTLDMFGRDKSQKDNLNRYCKTCVAEYGRKRYNSALSMDSHYRRKYNITYQEVLALAEQQNYLCLICEKTCSFFVGNRSNAFVVEHCHTTKTIRGLTCSSCNRAMGFMNDDPELLKRAAKYLENRAG